VFCNEGLKNIESSFRSVAEKMDFRIIEFNGEGNHAHALIEYPPKISISQLANHLKGVSSRMYRKGGYRCPSASAVWSPSYFAVSVGGGSLGELIEYIKNQARPMPS
jgi:putative transposase